MRRLSDVDIHAPVPVFSAAFMVIAFLVIIGLSRKKRSKRQAMVEVTIEEDCSPHVHEQPEQDVVKSKATHGVRVKRIYMKI